jgi:DNA-binding LacI/PurR family transcriptional regulator
MNDKRTTLKDIAQKLGVSKTLVSFVVRDLPDGHGNISVRPELRDQIKELAREMNYVAHRSARALRTGQSHMIGIISTSSDHPIHFAKQQVICDEVIARGYDYLLQDSYNNNPQRLVKALSMMLDYSVDGIILLGIPKDVFTEEQGNRIASAGIPIAACGGTSIIQGPCVRCAFYEAGYNLAKEMVNRGRRKFCVVSQTDFYRSSDMPGRIEGIHDACSEFGEVQIVMSRDSMRQTQSDIEIGYVTTVEALKTIDADCLFYTNDFMAFGGLKALAEAGIRVPEDMYVCGFDGVEVARFSMPPISTAIQATDVMAKLCVDALFDQLENGLNLEYKEIMVPAALDLRESTGDLSVLNTPSDEE